MPIEGLSDVIDEGQPDTDGDSEGWLVGLVDSDGSINI